MVEAVSPASMQLLKIAITLGVSSGTGERSFSCVQHIKAFLRSTMSTERLSSLAFLSVEEIASSLDLGDFVNAFAIHYNNLQSFAGLLTQN